MDKMLVLDLARPEIVRRIEEGARVRLHMSAAEFVQAFREGRIEEPGAVADLLALAHLLPDTDPLFVPS